MARLMPRESLNGLVANMGGVGAVLKTRAEETKVNAEGNLKAARASTTHQRLDKEGAHETSIDMGHTEGKYGHIDYEVRMHGHDPMATEFGHGPSGHFSPEKYGSVTKAPHGLYILTSAAGFEGLHMTPSMGRKAGKR